MNSANLPNPIRIHKGRSRAWQRWGHWWPMLLWLGAIALAMWVYGQGVVFRRMNGAVDVYQENISPVEAGNFDRLEKGIERGARVTDGQVLGYMRTTRLEEDIAVLKQEIEINRAEILRDLNDDLWKSEEELREIEGDVAASEAEKKACQEEIDGLLKQAGGSAQSSSNPYFRNQTSDFRIKIAKCDAIVLVGKKAREEVGKVRESITQQITTLTNEKDLFKIADKNQASKLAQLKQREATFVLRATRAGTVDRILKEPGEYVKPGESIMKIVGEPTQVIGFLSQEQVGNVKSGDTVWITPSMDRNKVFESKVLHLSPRMNTLPDVTGPMANSRVSGRDVVCAFPASSGLLPGQTVIIWIEPPGKIPLIGDWFSKDQSAEK